MELKPQRRLRAATPSTNAVKINRLLQSAAALEQTNPSEALDLYKYAIGRGSSIAGCKYGLLALRQSGPLTLDAIENLLFVLGKGYTELFFPKKFKSRGISDEQAAEFKPRVQSALEELLDRVPKAERIDFHNHIIQTRPSLRALLPLLCGKKYLKEGGFSEAIALLNAAFTTTITLTNAMSSELAASIKAEIKQLLTECLRNGSIQKSDLPENLRALVELKELKVKYTPGIFSVPRGEPSAVDDKKSEKAANKNEDSVCKRLTNNCMIL